MVVAVEYIENLAIQLNRSCPPLDGKVGKVWVVSATFCAGKYINDPRDLPGDQYLRLSNTDKPRAANAKFDVTGDNISSQQLSEFIIMAITATRNISKSDEIFSGHGNEYDFKMAPNTLL